ncbi:hypothetical protein GOODEAATRI_026997, partial [Goodea atripinnis]
LPMRQRTFDPIVSGSEVLAGGGGCCGAALRVIQKTNASPCYFLRSLPCCMAVTASLNSSFVRGRSNGESVTICLSWSGKLDRFSKRDLSPATAKPITWSQPCIAPLENDICYNTDLLPNCGARGALIEKNAPVLKQLCLAG